MPGHEIFHVQDDAIFRGSCAAAAGVVGVVAGGCAAAAGVVGVVAGVCAAAAGVVGVVAGILLGGDRRARAPGASLVFA